MIEHDRQELTYTIYNVLFTLVALCETYDHEGDDQEDRLVIFSNLKSTVVQSVTPVVVKFIDSPPTLMYI